MHLFHNEEHSAQGFGQGQRLSCAHTHDQFAVAGGSYCLSFINGVLILEIGAGEEHHLIGVQRLGDQLLLGVLAADQLTLEVGSRGSVNATCQFFYANGREGIFCKTELGSQPHVGICVNGKGRQGIVVVDNDAVVLHKDHSGDFAGHLFYPCHLVTNGKGKLGAGVLIVHPAPAVGSVLECLGGDFLALYRAGGKVGIHAVGVKHIGLQNGVEAGLHRGTQQGQALDGLDVILGALSAGLFAILKILGVMLPVESAQGIAVQQGKGVVHFNVLQAEAGGLDSHCAVFQLYRGVSAAALHVVCTAAGNVGKGQKALHTQSVFFVKHISYPLLLSVSVSYACTAANHWPSPGTLQIRQYCSQTSPKGRVFCSSCSTISFVQSPASCRAV